MQLNLTMNQIIFFIYFRINEILCKNGELVAKFCVENYKTYRLFAIGLLFGIDTIHLYYWHLKCCLYLKNNGNQLSFVKFNKIDKFGLTLFGIRSHPLYITCYEYCVKKQLFDKKSTIIALFNAGSKFHWMLEYYPGHFQEFIQKIIFNPQRRFCNTKSFNISSQKGYWRS